jgi:flagellar biogenesis protein FliO
MNACNGSFATENARLPGSPLGAKFLRAKQMPQLNKLLLWLSRIGSFWQLRSRPQKQLRLCETLGLGERRFLAVVQFEQQKFLIGGTGSSVALLANLPQASESVAARPQECRREECSAQEKCAEQKK